MIKNKKIFLLLLPLFFFLSCLNVNAETKDLVCLEPNNDNVSPCSYFLYSTMYYSEIENRYIYDENYLKDLSFSPGQNLNFATATNTSPPFPSVIYKLGSTSNYLPYELKKNKKYEFTYTFSGNSDFEIYEDDQSYLPNLYISAFDKDNNFLESNFFSFSNYGFMKKKTDESHYDYKLIFEFILKEDINKIRFTLGRNEPLEDKNYLPYIKNWNIENTGDGFFNYKSFSAKEVDVWALTTIPHGGSGTNIDKPTDNDNNIFNDLNKCDTLDIGCHLGNILSLLKNLFIRLGNIFNSIILFLGSLCTDIGDILYNIILFAGEICTAIGDAGKDTIINMGEFCASIGDFIYDGVITIGEFISSIPQLILDGLKSLFIPSDGFIETRFNALKIFLEDKFGIIFYPISFLFSVLSRFSNIAASSPIINIPTISLGALGTLIEGRTFAINEFWKSGVLGMLYTYYLVFVYFFVGYKLYQLLLSKLKSMFGVGSKDEEVDKK